MSLPQLVDIGCAVHLCSLLHQRYAEFSPLLLEQLQKTYSSPIRKDDDRSANVTKYRLGLRFLAEVYSVIIHVQMYVYVHVYAIQKHVHV